MTSTEQIPGVWYPPEMTVWALAHLVLNAEPSERAELADIAEVPEAGVDAWARTVIEQIGGEVSRHPRLGPGNKAAWSYTPPAKAMPPGQDWVSAGPQALWTVYRSGTHELALTPEECRRAIELTADVPGDDAYLEDDEVLGPRLSTLLACANEAWFRYPLNGVDKLRVQRYPVGRGLTEHYDRWIGATWVEHDGLEHLIPIPERVLVSVTLLQDCEAGGELRVRLKSTGFGWHTIDLAPGDTVVMSPWIPHEVTPVEAGHRLSLRCAFDYIR